MIGSFLLLQAPGEITNQELKDGEMDKSSVFQPVVHQGTACATRGFTFFNRRRLVIISKMFFVHSCYNSCQCTKINVSINVLCKFVLKQCCSVIPTKGDGHDFPAVIIVYVWAGH